MFKCVYFPVDRCGIRMPPPCMPSRVVNLLNLLEQHRHGFLTLRVSRYHLENPVVDGRQPKQSAIEVPAGDPLPVEPNISIPDLSCSSRYNIELYWSIRSIVETILPG